MTSTVQKANPRETNAASSCCAALTQVFGDATLGGAAELAAASDIIFLGVCTSSCGGAYTLQNYPSQQGMQDALQVFMHSRCRNTKCAKEAVHRHRSVAWALR